ncbi:MAG: hypothetical protein ABJG88_01285 [Litorimonas sp.]
MEKASSITFNILMGLGFILFMVSLYWMIARPSTVGDVGIPTVIGIGIVALCLSWTLRKALSKLGRKP